MSEPVFIITNCTNRKRATGHLLTLSESDLKNSLESVVQFWKNLVIHAPSYDKARNVYGGRSFTEAKNAEKVVNGQLYVVSAGLGLVHADERIPAYNLTVSKGSGSVAPFLNSLGKEPADWWNALTNEFGTIKSIHTLIAAHKDARFLFALPSSYLELISHDLSALTPEQALQIQILTSRLGQQALPTQLRQRVLPYDERLEGSNYAGTQTDFPQRALLHFVKELGGHHLDHEAANFQVQVAMATLMKRELPARIKKSDDEIKTLLEKNWYQFGGTSNRMLRFLRDDQFVACEQSRFRNLWHQVKKNKENEVNRDNSE